MSSLHPLQNAACHCSCVLFYAYVAEPGMVGNVLEIARILNPQSKYTCGSSCTS